MRVMLDDIAKSYCIECFAGLHAGYKFLYNICVTVSEKGAISSRTKILSFWYQIVAHMM